MRGKSIFFYNIIQLTISIHNRAASVYNALMNKPNVIIALGSPRKKGNTVLLAEECVKGIKAAGGSAEILFLQDMNIKPCTACEYCKKASAKRFCKLEDDMEAQYRKLMDAAAVVFASPVYWFTMTAQTKLFLDRFYALERKDGNKLAGKRIGILMAYGGEDAFESGAVNAFRTFQDSFGYIGAEITGIVHGSANKAGEIAGNKAVMTAAKALGRKLVTA